MNANQLALELETAFRSLSITNFVHKDNFLLDFNDEILRGLSFWVENGYISEKEKKHYGCTFDTNRLSEIIEDPFNLQTIRDLIKFLKERAKQIKQGENQ